MKKSSMCTIRLDDITPDMKWDSFYRLETIFDKYHFCPLIGVVPDNEDPTLKVCEKNPDFWKEIRRLQNKGWSIAQHGYKHVYRTNCSGLLRLRNKSEFAGIPLQEQYIMIENGKRILSENGVNTDIFMAPGHTYDDNTISALVNLKFKYMTDGYSSKAYKQGGLTFIPCTLSEAKRVNGIDTICLHLNHMKEDDFNHLENFFCCNRHALYDFKDVKEKVIPTNKNIWICLNETNRIYKKKIKRKFTQSKEMHEYIEKTYSTSTIKKLGKRIFWLPVYAFRILIGAKK